MVSWLLNLAIWDLSFIVFKYLHWPLFKVTFIALQSCCGSNLRHHFFAIASTLRFDFQLLLDNTMAMMDMRDNHVSNNIRLSVLACGGFRFHKSDLH